MYVYQSAWDNNQSTNRPMMRIQAPSKNKKQKKELDSCPLLPPNSPSYPPHPTTANDTYDVMLQLYVEHYGGLPICNPLDVAQNIKAKVNILVFCFKCQLHFLILLLEGGCTSTTNGAIVINSKEG